MCIRDRYYFYMCDMIPCSERWLLSLAEAQRLQHSIMGLSLIHI